ncbi:hypothetical protein SAMN02910456_00412 [Ruminococcaceae bacterium YRB3002]|nr:hypothetical protein SAMN02910456_00412 [Ruminococcaceae bacterium YRB3002]
MKMRKILCVLLAFVMVASMASCSSSKSKNSKDDDDDRYEDEYDDEDEDDDEDDEDDEEEEDKTSETSEKTEETTEESTAATTQKSPNPEPKTSDFIDFDDMSFYYNGKKYTLGVTTLQEMIDDGVPFEERDLKDVNEELENNHESMGFRLKLEDYWSANISVMNTSGAAQPMSQCVISSISLPSLDDEHTSNLLSFNFPLDLTMDSLVAAVGQPSEEPYHYDGDDGYYTDKYEYSRSSEKYYGKSKYQFEFTKGVLTRVMMDYLP